MDAPLEDRPFAVMFNNNKPAMPQHGISQADIFYEILTEGGITRCMGIFSDLSQVEKLGSIRSARKYFVDIAQSYDAIYLHAGGSNEAYNYLKNLGCDHLDGSKGKGAGSYFYRDQDRLDAGYSLEHTLFISGSKAVSYAEKMKCAMTRPGGIRYGLLFDREGLSGGAKAENVTVYFNRGKNPNSSTKKTEFSYSAGEQIYYAKQYGKDHVDGNTGNTVGFRNVLVLHASTTLQSDGILLSIDLTGSGKGHFFCNGQKVDILWSRESLKAPFVYTLADGTPLTMGEGKSYIAVVPNNAKILWQ